jgi:hypothetical protein
MSSSPITEFILAGYIGTSLYITLIFYAGLWPCIQEARVALQVDPLPRAGSSTIGRFPSPRQPPLYRDIFLTLNIVHTYSLCSI